MVFLMNSSLGSFRNKSWDSNKNYQQIALEILPVINEFMTFFEGFALKLPEDFSKIPSKYL